MSGGAGGPYHPAGMHPTATPRRRLWPWLLGAALAGAGLGAAGAAAWLASASSTYLALQASSDALHRAVVLGVPAAVVILALTWTLAELGRYLAWPRRIGRGLAALCLAASLGLPACVLVYDRGLEARGLEGELILPPAPPPAPAGAGVELGPYQEDPASPGLASAPLDDGSFLTLERRSLARKQPGGAFTWSRARPGPPPASLVLAGGLLAYTGPGPDFPDDALLEVCSLDSGRLWLRLHVLGTRASPAVPDGEAWVFSAARPATCEIHRVEPRAPARRWARRLAGPCAPPAPRPIAAGIQVAVGGELWLLERATGEPLSREAACLAPGRWMVACREGQVVAWVTASEERRP